MYIYLINKEKETLKKGYYMSGTSWVERDGNK